MVMNSKDRVQHSNQLLVAAISTMQIVIVMPDGWFVSISRATLALTAVRCPCFVVVAVQDCPGGGDMNCSSIIGQSLCGWPSSTF